MGADGGRGKERVAGGRRASRDEKLRNIVMYVVYIVASLHVFFRFYTKMLLNLGLKLGTGCC
jgi:hypothetical protein